MKSLAAFAALALASTTLAQAQSPEYMIEDCANNGAIFFQDFEAKSETKYEGQRTDGTHAVNGTIDLETRSEDFQCSYNAAGDTLVDFFAEGKSWPGFVRGEGSPHQSDSQGGGDAAQGSGAPGGLTAEVQFDRGKSGARLSGTITGNDYFDYTLGAKEGQTMSVDLKVAGTNGNGTIYFNILPPGSSDVADYIGSMDGNSARMQLRQSGVYTIRVYLMGNDRDTDKTVGYTVDVSIR